MPDQRSFAPYTNTRFRQILRSTSKNEVAFMFPVRWTPQRRSRSIVLVVTSLKGFRVPSNTVSPTVSRDTNISLCALRSPNKPCFLILTCRFVTIRIKTTLKTQGSFGWTRPVLGKTTRPTTDVTPTQISRYMLW